MSQISYESKLSYAGWCVAAMAFLASVITFGLIYSFSVFFKPLASEFSWSRASTAGAFSIYGITHNIFAFFSGWITDKFGPKVAVALGGLCLGISMVLMSKVSSIWELYFYYALIFGLGVAAIYGPMMATVSRWFTYKRGLAIGLTASGSPLGALAFSPLVAWLVSSYGWRAAYCCVGILAFVVFIPVTIFMKKSPVASFGTDTKSEAQGFSFREALKTRSLWTFGFSWLFIVLALFAIMVHIVPLITDKCVPLTMAGFLAGLIGAGGFIGRITAGFFSDKYGRKQILLTGYILQLIMLTWLLFSDQVWMFFLFAPLFGLGFGGWAGVIASFPADYFGLKATGTIFGFILIMVGIGVGIGPFIGGYIFDITNSYFYMIMMCIIATIVAIILILVLKPPIKYVP